MEACGLNLRVLAGLGHRADLVRWPERPSVLIDEKRIGERLAGAAAGEESDAVVGQMYIARLAALRVREMRGSVAQIEVADAHPANFRPSPSGKQRCLDDV